MIPTLSVKGQMQNKLVSTIQQIRKDARWNEQMFLNLSQRKRESNLPSAGSLPKYSKSPRLDLDRGSKFNQLSHEDQFLDPPPPVSPTGFISRKLDMWR